MKRLVAFCLARPITTLMIHISLLLLGGLAVTRLPLNSMPKSERPVIRVEIEYPNANPQQVEREITVPVEEVLATLRGVNSIDAESENGRCDVSLHFDWGADLDEKKVEVRERLARIRNELPIDDIERIRIRGARHSGDEIMKGRISSRGIDLSENYELLLNRIQRPLERIDGVSQVVLEGVTPLEIVVTFEQTELDRFGLQLDDVIRRLREHDSNLTVAETLEEGRLRRARVIAGFRGIDSVRAFPLTPQGLRLDRVAQVDLVEGELRFGRHLNRSFAVSIEVFKESSANTVEVCRDVNAAIAKLGEDPELEGIDVLIWNDQGQDIIDSLDGLKNTGIVGSLLALAILWFFLRRASATVLVGLSIPISVLSALAWLYLLDRELNIVTIVALMLGVGMLVDTAVVVVESIVRLASEGRSPRDAASEGTMEVATPIFAATLTSVIVFIPVALGPSSQMSDYLKEVGLVITLTLGSSLFVSLTLIPMASARIFRRGESRSGRLFPWVLAGYEKLLRGVLHHPGRALAVAAAAIASVVLPLRSGFGVNLEDQSRIEKNASVFYQTEQSLDWRTMERHVDAVEDALFEHRDEIGFADVYSWYKDNFAWTAVYPQRPMTEKELAEFTTRIEHILPTIPGVQVRTGDWGMFWGRGRGSRSAGARNVRVFGDSNDRVQSILVDLQGLFAGVDGVASTEVRHRESVDEVTVTPDEELLTHHGLSSDRFSQQVSSFFAGRTLSEVRTSDGERRLRVRMNEEERNSLAELESFEVVTASGARLPVSELSTIGIGPGPGQLRREERQSSGSLSVQMQPTAMDRADAIVEQTLASYDWPRGYGYEVGSGRWQLQQNESQFGETMILAVFLVFLVMACLFESLVQPFLIMVTVVLALPGVVWFLHASGDDLDQPASIGLVLLAGIVVNNGIVFVDHINRYRSRGLELFEAIVRGGCERLRPILITALTTVIGLVPMAYSAEITQTLARLGLPVEGRIGAQAAGMYYFTLARTIIGGLTVSTLLTLVVLPVFYWLLARTFSPHRASVAIDNSLSETRTTPD
ncbi:MAG: efflux RND transporter permease subunit [Planctomycetes bacterium]|nr:efflux RND transporter permease subunit [Planctomycetota bacterium]